ncbi:18027_t:CDS:2, partial [Dentiscutata erythropus]
MGISTTGCSESSHGDLKSVFHYIEQAMCSQHLKAAISTGSYKPIKLLQKVVSKSNTKQRLLQNECQDFATKKKKDNITKLKDETIQQIFQNISAYFNVIEDDNCGFHTVAISIEKSEEYWPE